MPDWALALLEPILESTYLLLEIGVLLLLTLAVELLVGVSFRLSKRGLLALCCANLVTNPVLNLVLALSLGVTGYPPSGPGLIGVAISYVAVVVLEVLVVVAEWMLLRWMLGTSEGSSRKLLRLSLTANVASFVVGPAGFAILWSMLVWGSGFLSG